MKDTNVIPLPRKILHFTVCKPGAFEPVGDKEASAVITVEVISEMYRTEAKRVPVIGGYGGNETFWEAVKDVYDVESVTGIPVGCPNLVSVKQGKPRLAGRWWDKVVDFMIHDF